MNLSNLKRMLALASLAIAVAGCVGSTNPWQTGVAPKNYFYGDKVPSADYFAAQTTVVRPHCRQFAQQTNPSAQKVAGAYAVNHGLAGFVGGTVGMATDSAIVLGPVDAPTALGAGTYNGVASAMQGSASGAETRDLKVTGEEDACVVNNTAGFRSVAPSELDELQRTGHSESLEKAVAVDPAPKNGVRPVQ